MGQHNKSKPRHAMYDQAITAIEDGDLCVIEALVDNFNLNPKDNGSELLRWAAKRQQPHIVKYLIPLSEPKAMDSLALRWACEEDGLECVELLLPHSNPKAADSAALRLAVTHENYEATKILIPVSDPKKALNYLLTHRGSHYGRKNVPETLIEMCEAYYSAEQKKVLEQAIETVDTPSNSTTRKM